MNLNITHFALVKPAVPRVSGDEPSVPLAAVSRENRSLPRDNQDESGATIKMREPQPVSSRREGVARP